jgi:hypothetical protein
VVSGTRLSASLRGQAPTGVGFFAAVLLGKRKAALRPRFDRIFTRQTGFVTLDRLLAAELLMAFERSEIPLHTNGSENDVRCQVTKRKVSGGTRSDAGRDCRDGASRRRCSVPPSA